MYLDDIDQKEREKIGRTIIDMKAGYETLRNFLFLIDENEDAIAERMEGASKLFDVFGMWIRGEDPSYIGESIFQDDEECIQKILAIVGIDDEII